MRNWLLNDAVIFDIDPEEILLNLLHDGVEINEAIALIEETQNIIIEI